MTFDLMKKSISLKFNLANIPTHFGKKTTNQPKKLQGTRGKT